MKDNVKIAQDIFNSLCDAFGGPSQFGLKEMINAVLGHARNGKMSPNTDKHNYCFVSSVAFELIDLYFNGGNIVKEININAHDEMAIACFMFFGNKVNL